MGNKTNNWINEIQMILHSTGMCDVWLCQFVYFGSAIMLVTYFVNFR